MVSSAPKVASGLGAGTPEHSTGPYFGSSTDAEREAETWLTRLVENSGHDWGFVSRLAMRTQPVPELPCDLLALTTAIEELGYAPYLMLMAGKKRSNRYWQYVTRDTLTGVPHSREKSLADIDNLVSTYALLAPIPHKYQSRRLPPVDTILDLP